ncbi:uncharacterized protein ACOB8E_005250 isoform 1-T1 [Sarcophilus harrisii]
MTHPGSGKVEGGWGTDRYFGMVGKRDRITRGTSSSAGYRKRCGLWHSCPKAPPWQHVRLRQEGAPSGCMCACARRELPVAACAPALGKAFLLPHPYPSRPFAPGSVRGAGPGRGCHVGEVHRSGGGAQRRLRPEERRPTD